MSLEPGTLDIDIRRGTIVTDMTTKAYKKNEPRSSSRFMEVASPSLLLQISMTTLAAIQTGKQISVDSMIARAN